MRTKPLATLVLSVFVVAAGARPLWASCNTIPAPREQLLGASNPDAAAVALSAALIEDERQFGGTVPYKGALGRIDRVYLSSLRKDPLRVALDGQCVGRGPGKALAVDGTKDLVAAVILTEGDGETSTALLATGEGLSCDALAPGDGRAPTVAGCASGGIKRSDERVLTLPIRAEPSAGMARRARVAVFRATSAEVARTMLDRIATTDCDHLCADAAVASELGVCIDTLYAPVALAAKR